MMIQEKEAPAESQHIERLKYAVLMGWDWDVMSKFKWSFIQKSELVSVFESI